MLDVNTSLTLKEISLISEESVIKLILDGFVVDQHVLAVHLPGFANGRSDRIGSGRVLPMFGVFFDQSRSDAFGLGVDCPGREHQVGLVYKLLQSVANNGNLQSAINTTHIFTS